MMSKEIMYVSIFVLLLSLMSMAQAATVSVSSKTGDWNTVTWDSGASPAGNGDTALLIDSRLTLSAPGITGSLTNLYIAHVLDSSLTIDAGANLSVSNEQLVGRMFGTPYLGTLNVYGSNDAVYLKIGAEAPGGVGIVNVYSGGLLKGVATTDIGSASGGFGIVNLIGSGNMDVNVLNILATGVLDIEAGKLRAAGDQITALAAYISGGKITGYGGTGTVNAPVLGTGGDAGYTVVTANTPPPTCASQGVYLPGDFNQDCYVDIADLLQFIDDWLKCDELNPGCQGDNYAAFNEGYPFSFTYGGLPSRGLLPQWTKQVQTNVLDANRTQDITTWVDPSSGLKVTFDKITYSDFPAVDWLLYFENTGTANTGIIENIQALDTSIYDPGYILHKTNGNLPNETQFDVSILPISQATPQVLSAENGVSAYKDLPFFKVETDNSSIIIAVGWTGNWKATMESPDDVVLQLKAGMRSRDYLSDPRFYLYPGEKVRTPRILAMVWEGETIESNAQFRQLIYKHYSPLRNGQEPLPVVSCNTCFTRDGWWLTQTTEENQISLINAYAPLDVDIMVTDAGWMVGCIDEGNQWGAGQGSWFPRADHYPNGFGPVAAAAAANGQIWGLWFSEEIVQPGSIIDVDHPELEIGTLLNFGDPDAIDYMYNILDDLFNLPGFGVYRHDGGSTPTIEPEGVNRMGITEIKYVMGLYEYWDRIATDRPNSYRIFAGHRIDLEILKRFHVHQKSDIWCNPLLDQSGLWALSQYLPNNRIECALDQYDDYTFHSMLASSMVCGFVADANDPYVPDDPDDPYDFDFLRAQEIIAKYRSVAHLLVGAWYPLLPYSRVGTVWMASQYHRPDLDQGIVLAFRHSASTESTKVLQLHGLTPTTTYDLYFNSTDQTISYTGAALMQGLSLTIPNTLQSELIEYKIK